MLGSRYESDFRPPDRPHSRHVLLYPRDRGNCSRRLNPFMHVSRSHQSAISAVFYYDLKLASYKPSLQVITAWTRVRISSLKPTRQEVSTP